MNLAPWVDAILLAVSAALLSEIVYLFVPRAQQVKWYLGMVLVSVLMGIHRWVRFGDPSYCVASAIGIGLGAAIGFFLVRKRARGRLR